MNLMQAFKMAFKSIASKKMRSFLTMLGIIIGVASVVIMVSVMQGQAKKNLEYFEKMGDKIFKDGTKLGNAVKRYVTGKLPTGGVMIDAKQIQAALRQHKTAMTMVLAAGIGALTILAKGIYNAGKIDG